MKKILTILLFSFTLVKGETLTTSANQFINLAWNFPTSYWQSIQATAAASTNASNQAALTNLVYFLYSTPTFNGTNTQWNSYAVITNPPILTNTDGSLYHMVTVPLLFPPQQQFFTLQVSNVLGKSFFSGPAATPPAPPSQGNFQIQSAR